MNSVTVRRATSKDAPDFARLAVYTAPEYLKLIFGPDPLPVLEALFRHPDNLFSHTHAHFMEVDGEVAGMSLFYDYAAKQRGTPPLVMLIMKEMRGRSFRALRTLLRFAPVFARIGRDDMYSSNSALYPKFRARGFGARLFSLSEEKAREQGLKRVVVDVKADNEPAISLRRKLGYRIEEKLPAVSAGGMCFEYLKLVKDLP